jgi:hypothetical protein
MDLRRFARTNKPASRRHTAWGYLTILVALTSCQTVAPGTDPGNTIEVSSVEVTPGSVTLTSIGATQQFTATARDASNNGISGQTFAWTSSDSGVARVNSAGLATAVANGTATIAAATGGKQGTASVTVATAPLPTVLFEEKFDDANLGARGWYDLRGAGIITTQEHIPGSTASLEVRFSQGGTNPDPPAGGRHLFTETDAVYLRYWVKYSSNWVGSGKPYHPHEFYFLTNQDNDFVGPGYTFLTTYVEHNYQNGGFAVLAAQDGKNVDTTRINQDLTNVTENRAVAGCNGNSDGTTGTCYKAGSFYYNGKDWKSAQAVFAPNPGPGYKNDWHKIEVYYKLNSIQNGKGQLDGVAQYWFDGQLVIDKRNVLLRTGAKPNMKFKQFMLAPYIGDGSPAAQTMWIDELVVMTARP